MPDSHISALRGTYTHTSEARCVVLVLMQGCCRRVIANLLCHQDMNERKIIFFGWFSYSLFINGIFLHRETYSFPVMNSLAFPDSNG